MVKRKQIPMAAEGAKIVMLQYPSFGKLYVEVGKENVFSPKMK